MKNRLLYVLLFGIPSLYAVPLTITNDSDTTLQIDLFGDDTTTHILTPHNSVQETVENLQSIRLIYNPESDTPQMWLINTIPYPANTPHIQITIESHGEYRMHIAEPIDPAFDNLGFIYRSLFATATPIPDDI